jgi:transposase
MLDGDERTAILKLAAAGHGAREIARALGVSRNAVRRVLRSGQAAVPALERPEKLGEHVALVQELHQRCEGNLARVSEELSRAGIVTGYSSLTAFCRRHGIGVVEKTRVGRYRFEPGEEMQHDTSPHIVVIGGRRVRMQCASLVLCYSRRVYAQVYERWSRFECRVFLSEGMTSLGGAARRCMIDNSSVIIARGTGKDAVPAEAMKALGERFGFVFEAHALGDADRSAHVERRFHFIENNFYVGRSFADESDCNAQLRQWCEQVADRHRRDLGATSRQLWVAELPSLVPLPIHIPEVYEVHSRRVDVEGYVALHTNRYSMPERTIGRQVSVRESIDRIRIFDGHACIAVHARKPVGARVRETLPEHEGHWRRREPPPASAEETTLRNAAADLGVLVDRLRARHGGQALRTVKRLHKIWLDYPTTPVVEAVEHALRHGLIDLERIERMVLRRIAGDFFRLPTDAEPEDEDREPEPDPERAT